MAPNVKFCRVMQLGFRGNDIIAHKRALSRAFPKLYPWWKKGFSDYYGQAFKDAVKGAQLVMKLPTTGQIDKTTHDALKRRHRALINETEWAFDEYSIRLADIYCTNHAALTKRELIVNAGFFWYVHRKQIAYSQTRPFQVCKPPQVPSRWDCSAFVTNCYYAGKATDPNGRDYDGLGYTGTLISHGTRCDFSELEPADLIFYGFSSGKPGFSAGSPTHVAMYVGGGNVLSMGSYPMGFYDYNYRRDINTYMHYNI